MAWRPSGLLAFATDGIFLSPRNLYNFLSIQTCVTAIMACGMVFIIVARQIDLGRLADGLHRDDHRLVQVTGLGAETPAHYC